MSRVNHLGVLAAVVTAIVTVLVLQMTPALARPKNRVTTELRWYVAKDGRSTKRFEVRYQGRELLDELVRMGGQRQNGDFDYVEAQIPFHEREDRLLNKKKLGPGHFVWVYRAQKQPTQIHAKNSLLLHAPVFEDPLMRIWEPVGESRYRYRSRSIEIKHRMIVRAPWEFEGGLSKKNDSFREAGIKGEQLTERVWSKDESHRDLPGWDLPGVQMDVSIEGTRRELDSREYASIRDRYIEWYQTRTLGAALAGVPGSEDELPGESVYRWGSAFEVGYGGLSVNQQPFDAFVFGFQIGVKRQYSRYFGWHLGMLSVDYQFGGSPNKIEGNSDRDGYDHWGIGLSSLVSLRYPYYSTTRTSKNGSNEKTLNFVEVYFGPRLQQSFLNDDGTLNSFRMFSPGGEVGLRWTQSSARIGFLASGGLGFRYRFFARRGQVESQWMFLLETIL